ncbi:MAG: hypothetical protein IJK99_09215 [Bacteroidales bacterium]|nr:hypothetical protein [Bacteroidales bacterium]
MGMSYSAQGSITVKRLRNGDTFFISFDLNGIPLFQGVDPVTGIVTPDWTVAANQPVITPVVTSARGNVVSLGGHQWSYNGVALLFNGATSGNWTTDSTGKFQLNNTTGALKIIANLASTTNIASDNLLYTCVATVAGVEYNLSKSVDIQIQSVGASSYYGTINATSEQLTALVTQTTVSTKLYLGGTEQNGYYVKWYKDDTLWSEKSGQASITVGRGDVDGTQLIIAEFYKSSSDATPVFRAGIRIIDTLDDFHVEFRYVNSGGTTSNANREVDVNNPVYVQAYVVNVRTNTEVTVSGMWKAMVMDKDSWAILKTVQPSVAAATVTCSVTTTETDAGGVEKDVEVVAEVTWTD